MFSLLVIIAVIIGVAYLLSERKRRLSRESTKFLPALDRWRVADMLDEWSGESKYKRQASTFRAIAEALRSGNKPIIGSRAKTAKAIAPTAQKAPAAKPRTAKKQDHDIHPLELLENINVLLFIGAFLVVISVAILVGTNYQLVSDVSKMSLVLIFTAVFFGFGLWFYQQKKLRPAGIAFTSIGMVLVPLLGVAFHNFISPTTDNAVVMFGTSILAMIAYGLSAQVIKHWSVQYALILAVVSSVQTGLLSFDVPLYALSWTGVLIAGGMLLASRSKGNRLKSINKDPMATTALILGPIALLSGVLNFFDTNNIFPLAVTCLLAGGFYLEQSLLSRRIAQSKTDLGIGLGLVISGIILLIFHYDVSVRAASLAIFGLSALILTAHARPSNKWLKRRHDVLDIIVHLTALIAVLTWPTEGDWWIAVTIFSGLHFSAYALTSDLPYLWNAMIGLILLPGLVGYQQGLGFDGYSDRSAVAAFLYLGESLTLLTIRKRFVREKLHVHEPFRSSPGSIIIMAYWLALGLSFVLSFGSTLNIQLAITWLALISSYAMSWYERTPEFQYVSHFLAFVSLVLLRQIFNLDLPLASLALLYGAFAYGVGHWLDTDKKRFKFLRRHRLSLSVMWRGVGLAGLALGVLNGTYQLQGIASLALLSGAVALEADRLKKPELGYLSAVGFALASSWLAYNQGVEEVLLHSLIWSVTTGSIAFSEHKRSNSDARDVLVLLTLFALTGPLAIQTLEHSNLWRALLLSGLALLTVFVGLAWRYRLVWMWGLVLLIGEVLYQSRGVLAAIPKQMITLLVGVLILGIAIYFLNRRNEK